MEFTELLDDLRLNRFTDVVQKKTLAEAIQLSSVMVYYNYESGTTKKPNMEIIERLCDFYRVSADYFISSPFRQYACSVPYMIGYNSKKSVWFTKK